MRLLLLALLALPGLAQATPRMSLTAGTPCAACHVNPSGGEGRSELGFGAMHRVGVVTWDQLGLQAFHDVNSNTWLDGAVGFGVDLRMQGARLGRPELVDTDTGTKTEVPDYTWFPMQAQPYLTVKPAAGLTLYGTFLAGPGTLRDGKICDPVFQGMSCYGAQAIYEPGGVAPTVRAGVFQPSIGVRNDDHTLLIRGDAAARRVPIIAPGYAEAGAEVAWQPVQWVRLEAGGFHTGNLDKALNDGNETAELWPVAYQARVTFQPLLELGGGPPPAEADEFGDDFGAPSEPAHPFVINTWLGASAFGSGDFLMINAFLGLGIHEGLSLLSELSLSQRTIEYETLNGVVGLSYAPWAWIAASARAERARTTTATAEITTVQYVAGLELFVVPGLEVRPEYRLVETDDYRFGQATLQVHLFY
ncbi:MAG: hypothetical protein H6706_05845 [Myxococcales bacterium]|nr:hypothetical protein [bacterium]MCB9545403.1 hypothetical protein [Myxococcales bacterium]